MSPSSSPVPDPAFPSRLQDVPANARVAERFGWGWIGIGLLLYAMVADHPFSWRIWQVLCVTSPIFCAGYEVYRRLNRKVLVARGTAIGFYWKGALRTVIGLRDITPYET